MADAVLVRVVLLLADALLLGVVLFLVYVLVLGTGLLLAGVLLLSVGPLLSVGLLWVDVLLLDVVLLLIGFVLLPGVGLLMTSVHSPVKFLLFISRFYNSLTRDGFCPDSFCLFSSRIPNGFQCSQFQFFCVVHKSWIILVFHVDFALVNEFENFIHFKFGNVRQ